MKPRHQVLAALALIAVGLALFLPPMPQPLAYHDFADKRSAYGIANFLDVASNASFLLAGLAILAVLAARPAAFEEPRERWPWLVFAIGLLMTGAGSCHYHLDPGNETLFWDRLPMTIAFMALIAAQLVVGGLRNVKLDIVSVSFSSDFDPARGARSPARRLHADDLVAIKENLSAMTREIFAAELAEGGYRLVDAPGPDTLLVSAAIVDLFITAPDPQSTGRSRTFTADSGRMTIVLELRDSVTGELMARVVDRQTGRRDGTWSITNRVTNTADARRAIRNWAVALREGLDELSARSGQGQ